MMSLLHHYSIPLARVVRPSPRTRAAISFATSSSSSSPRTIPQSQVLLGLSETELQKLALDFGQVNFFSFFIYLHSYIINLNLELKKIIFL